MPSPRRSLRVASIRQNASAGLSLSV
jgi:hypothetical protein